MKASCLAVNSDLRARLVVTFGFFCRYAFWRQAEEQYWASDRVGMNLRLQKAQLIASLSVTLSTSHLQGFDVTAAIGFHREPILHAQGAIGAERALRLAVTAADGIGVVGRTRRKAKIPGG